MENSGNYSSVLLSLCFIEEITSVWNDISVEKWYNVILLYNIFILFIYFWVNCSFKRGKNHLKDSDFSAAESKTLLLLLLFYFILLLCFTSR